MGTGLPRVAALRGRGGGVSYRGRRLRLSWSLVPNGRSATHGACGMP